MSILEARFEERIRATVEQLFQDDKSDAWHDFEALMVEFADLKGDPLRAGLGNVATKLERFHSLIAYHADKLSREQILGMTQWVYAFAAEVVTDSVDESIREYCFPFLTIAQASLSELARSK